MRASNIRSAAIYLALGAHLLAQGHPVKSIRVQNRSQGGWLKEFQSFSEKPIRIGLDLGESPDEISIELIVGKNSSGMIVEWSYETSLTIQNEGPHLDLIDWKHFNAPWSRITPTKSGIYDLKSPATSPLPFPHVSMSEVRSEVARRGGLKWKELISRANSIRDEPFDVGVSMIRVRVSKIESGKLIPIQIFEFPVLMGC